MKRLGAGFIIGAQRALRSLLPELPQLFTLSFGALDTLLDEAANLLLLIVGQVQLAQHTGAENTVPVTETATFAATTRTLRSIRFGRLPLWVLRPGSRCEDQQGQDN